MRLGRDLEDYVADRFMEATGKKLRRTNAMYVNDQYPFMMANVDRLVVGERAGVECKTASPYTSDRWKDGNVPEWYYLQCQHYIKTLEMDGWYLAVLIFGRGFQYTYIPRDEEMLEDLVSIENSFWFNHVQAGVMPSPDGSRGADEVIQKYFHDREGMIRLEGLDEQITRRNELAALVKKMQTEQKAIEQELKMYLGKEQAQIGISDHYRVTWKEFESQRIDTERLKKEQPEIYQTYSKVQKSSRLSIQAA
jgi:predicted phage-related endonuclease